MGRILDTLNSPQDLKALSASQLSELAAELRDFVTDTVSKTGGHLAPNLGVVELTLALHAAFDAPRDKIVWDVGHQSYIHKILTGRRDRFHTLRQTGGISGFPKISESEYDAFGAGHASTAISAALGIATARDLNGEDFRVVAVVGDGALTGGLAFEGMNNSGAQRRDLLVVLNDNQMSISRNVGALSRYLNILISAPLYNRLRHNIWMLTGRLARGSGFVRRGVQRVEKLLKSVLLPSVLFERLGFRYFGPIDGHDLPQLLRLFREVRKLPGPILVHVLTTKGKGYKYAEEDATRFHGVGSFCVETGASAPKQHATFTEIFGRTLVELAEKDPKLVAITAAMTDGTGLVDFAKRFPERFFDVGIAEAHAVTFAAGLAMQGLKPVVAIYSTFLQRGLDQIIHDVALQSLPVIFAVDRGGLVGEDGPTHHGSFDLSFLRMIPNLVVMAPRDENEFRDMLFTATLYAGGPIAIRYPRSETNGAPLRTEFRAIPIGRAETLREGGDAAVFAVGDMAAIALCAADILKARGVSLKVVNARFVKPLDVRMLEETAAGIKTLITLENNTVVGGFGSGISEALDVLGLTGIRMRSIGLPDRFVPHGGLKDLFVQTGLDPDSVARIIGETFFMTIGIFANIRKAKLLDIIGPFLGWLEKRDIRVLMTGELHGFLAPSSSNVGVASPEAFASQCDLVVAMGGDGTMLSAARLIGAAEKPLLGVNLGSLGFLAEVSVDDLYPRMEKVLDGSARIEKRMVLEAKVRDGNTVRTYHALNDVVLDRGGSPRIIRIRVDVNGLHFNTFHSDGLIVSTPTGSTAYSLSASGPIVMPTHECMILNPICSHSLSARPIVVPAESAAVLRLETPRHEALLSVDGQLHTAVDKSTSIEIRRAAHSAHLLTFDDHNFFDLLRRKLHWGSLPRK